MEDFKRELNRKQFMQLTVEERRAMLDSLPPRERLAGLTAERIREYLDGLTAGQPAAARKPRRKR